LKSHERLRRAREAAGFRSAIDVARALGIPAQTYYSHESGRNHLSLEVAQRYAELFRVPVSSLTSDDVSADWQRSRLSETRLIPMLGRVAAGVWLEAPVTEPAEGPAYLGEVPILETFGGARHFALLVDGTSMDKLFRHGEYAIASPWEDVGRDVKDGDVVVLQRERGGLYEATLKRARLAADGGRMEFWPESTDPKWQTPITLDDAAGAVVTIIGLVVSRFSPIV
jgi:SOS-response transcriptional repressor LexA